MRSCGYSYEAFSSLKAAVTKEGACRLNIDAFVTLDEEYITLDEEYITLVTI